MNNSQQQIPAINLEQELQRKKPEQLRFKQEFSLTSRNNYQKQPNRSFKSFNNSQLSGIRHIKNKSTANLQTHSTQRYHNNNSFKSNSHINLETEGRDQILYQQMQEKDKYIEKLQNQLSASFSRINQKQEQSIGFNIQIDKNSRYEVEELKSVLCELIQGEQHLFGLLQQRCQNLGTLVRQLDPETGLNFENQKDYIRFQEHIDYLTSTLVDSAKTEIDLGAKIRENERINIELSMQKLKVNNLQEKNNDLQKVIEIVQNQNKILTEESSKLQRQLNIEKKNSDTYQKKSKALEKRIEFILENDINTQLNPNDKLRNSLNELLRENESLKRDLTHKNQEIERQAGTIKKLDSFISRLNKKIGTMKKGPTNGQHEGGQQTTSYADESSKFYKKDDIDLLSNYVIPENLDYRIISLKSEYMNVLSDVAEIGPLGFSNHVIKSKEVTEQQEMVCLVTNQFLSYKELAEKLNFIIRDISFLYRYSDLKDIILSINNKFNSVFNASRINLWVVEGSTGLLITYNEIHKRKCIMNKGIIGEVFYYKQALNIKNAKAKALLYTISEDSYKEEANYVDTTLLLPIFTQNDKIKAVIEISNSQHDLFSFDEEYLGIVLAKYLGLYFQHFIEKQVVSIELKFKNMMFNAFEELSLSQTRYQFQELVNQWIFTLFGVSMSLFYFVEDELLTIYDKQQNKTQFNLEHGLVGLVAKQQKGFIINDIKYSSIYNNLVDLKTIMPVYAIPLIQQTGQGKQVIAVMELSLKNQFKSKFEKDQLIDPDEGLLGVDEPISNMIQNFSKLIAMSLRHIILSTKL